MNLLIKEDGHVLGRALELVVGGQQNKRRH